MFKAQLPPRILRERTAHEKRTCPAHRAWVRTHHCSVPGCKRVPTECAHVRRGTDGGIGLKPSDQWALSLCSEHHREQHALGEAAFEKRYELCLMEIAARFARYSPHWKKLTRD